MEYLLVILLYLCLKYLPQLLSLNSGFLSEFKLVISQFHLNVNKLVLGSIISQELTGLRRKLYNYFSALQFVQYDMYSAVQYDIVVQGSPVQCIHVRYVRYYTEC